MGKSESLQYQPYNFLILNQTNIFHFLSRTAEHPNENQDSYCHCTRSNRIP